MAAREEELLATAREEELLEHARETYLREFEKIVPLATTDQMEASWEARKPEIERVIASARISTVA